MSPSVYKILMHEAQVIIHAVLPVWQLSEEAVKARNNNFKQYRLNFLKQIIETNLDIFNRLLLTCLGSIRRKVYINKLKNNFVWF